MKRNSIDRLIQLAFLKGDITTHGLYEQTAVRRHPKTSASANARRELLEKLEAGLKARQTTIAAPFTLGSFLRKAKTEHSFTTGEIVSKVGISANIYRMLEQDRLSPLKISVVSWRRLIRFFDVPTDMLAEMIRRTYQLVFFAPSYRTTLARYKQGKSRAKKFQVLEAAARELYARADLVLPAEEEQKLSDFIKTITG
jgi:transcriptional regulator with XRE-family HTH domain